MTNQYFIIDFDSTIIQTESLDELAKITLKENPQRKQILEKIEEITKLGMEGKLNYTESLRQRLSLIRVNKSHVQALIQILKKQISPSVLRNKHFFKTHKDHIYILTGGFKEIVDPIADELELLKEHVLGNSFIYDKGGNVLGIDNQNPLSQDGGKIETVRRLKLQGEIVMIGDGYNDLQLKISGVAKHFYAFTENVTREIVVKEAKSSIGSFDEFLKIHPI